MSTRREFLATTAAATLAAAATRAYSQETSKQATPGPNTPRASGPAATPPDAVPAFPPPTSTKNGDMLYRTLGNSGQTVSLLGLGGFHLSIPKTDDEATRIIHKAIDAGVTFMDNCWDYAEGKSEERMGKALKEGDRRDKIFLMTKLDGRTAKSANEQLDESLKRLQTDHIDLVQIHEVLRMEDPDRCFEPDGVAAALLAAQKAGKCRFLGFTGHKDPLVHLRMLEACQLHNFPLTSVQMPLNVMDAHFRSFTHNVLPVLVERNIAPLGMKPLAAGEILKSNTVSAIDCLHFAMSLPTAVVITGCDSEPILDQALEAVRTFQPFTHDQFAALLAKTKEVALTGRFERFKTSNTFDGTAKNPKWLG